MNSQNKQEMTIREIKFRAWDSISNKMHENVCSHNANNFKVNEDEQKWFIMQFTGLEDMDGTEIYEGDKLIWCNQSDEDDDNSIFIVGFEDGSFSMDRQALSEYDLDSFKIIGNIYENDVKGGISE